MLAWYQRRLAEGLPEKNINRMAPMLTLTTMGIAQETREHQALIEEYAHWIEHELLRTQENGFTHCTSDHLNEEQLWVDTLFMSGLFYARASAYLNRPSYRDEVSYQFLLHIKYLIDRDTGLWMHGWNFTGNGNYGKALWGRGNGWAAISTVDFLEMLDQQDASYQMILNTLRRQADADVRYQDVIAKRLNFDYTIWTENKLSVSQPISLFLLFACAHLCSIGLRSGEYVGKYSTIYPASMMTC